MADAVNMSLDEIIKKSRASRTRGRGGGGVRGRGARGGGRGAGRGRGAPAGVARNPRSASRGPQNRSRSRSRARSQSRGRSQTRAQSQPRGRSRSRQRFRSNSRARSTSRARSRSRGLTPRGRAGLEEQQSNLPPLVRTRFGNRGGQRNGLRRSNSNPNLRGGVHSRLGTTFSRGTNRPLAVAKRGIAKRGRGLATGNRYSTIGLRSDQIIKEQRLQNSLIQSQTFTRSRSRNSFGSPSQLTVSVANDIANKRRRNSVGNAGYLNKQSLAQLNNQYGGYTTRRGPGSVKSLGSNKSNRSNASNRSRGRGRGRGGGRGGIKYNAVNKQILNPKLQKEIAAIQGKTAAAASELPSGVNFTPTPTATTLSLHSRFGAM